MASFYSLLVLALTASLAQGILLGDRLNHTVYFNTSAYEQVRTDGHALLRGMKMSEVSPNGQKCLDAALHLYFKELPIMQIRYHYGNMNNNMLNTTKLIRNIT